MHTASMTDVIGIQPHCVQRCYVNELLSYRDAMIAKHIVTIRSITNSGAGLVVILQVQTSSTVLSAAVVTQALLVSSMMI